MKGTVKNANKGMKLVVEVFRQLAGGFQEYWSNFVEQNLVVITGRFEDYGDCTTIGRNPMRVTFGRNYRDIGEEYQQYVEVDGIYCYKDEISLKEFICADEYSILNLGFRTINGDYYLTDFRLDGSIFWKFVDKFFVVKEKLFDKDHKEYREECCWYNFMPIRWLGAYNTNANGKGKSSFEQALRYETDACEREKAAQAVISMEELKALCEHRQYANYDGVNFSKVGVLYDYGSCREVYQQDVWSVNAGKFLVPTRENQYDNVDMHKIYPDDGVFLQMAAMMCKNDDDLLYEYDDKASYLLNLAEKELVDSTDIYFCKRNQELLEDVAIEAGYTIEELKYLLEKVFNSNITTAKAIVMAIKRDFWSAINRMPAFRFIGRYCGNVSYHNEAFVKVGSKPTAIVVRGRISNSSYEIVKRVAKEKNLEILHF